MKSERLEISYNIAEMREKKQILELQIKHLKQEKNEIKITRSDKGKQRAKYDQSLPKDYLSYLKRANKKQIPFEFTVDQFNEITNNTCTYCGQQPAKGIDRMNSKEGYTKDNSVPCCTKCNTMKFVYTAKDFLEHVRKIYSFNR